MRTLAEAKDRICPVMSGGNAFPEESKKVRCLGNECQCWVDEMDSWDPEPHCAYLLEFAKAIGGFDDERWKEKADTCRKDRCYTSCHECPQIFGSCRFCG